MGEKKIRDSLWTIDDLASYLKLPRSTTYLLVAQKKLPSIPLGKHRRFNPDDVIAALRRLEK